MNRRTTLAFPCFIAAFALACADSTEPIILPPDGEYVLLAATSSEPTGSEWVTLPFEYDILAGDSSCVFRLLGGTIAVTDRSYTADLQQEIVSCESGTEPLSHEAGQLARVYRGNGFNGQFAFVSEPGTTGWLNFAEVIEGEFLVALTAPVDSAAVQWLRFQRR